MVSSLNADLNRLDFIVNPILFRRSIIEDFVFQLVLFATSRQCELGHACSELSRPLALLNDADTVG